MATNSQTIAEAIEKSLNAYNIISQKALEQVSADRTIKCKIVDDTGAADGVYVVTDGSSRFKAYSRDASYIKGNLVWVTVPLGDMTQQKIIAGKYLESDNSEPYTYVPPLSSFLDITENLISPAALQEIREDVTSPMSLIANGDIEKKILWAVSGVEFYGYDRLAISAGFKSWLRSLGVQSGHYGLELTIVYRDIGTTRTDSRIYRDSVRLDVDDFYGDAYNFETFYTQQKVVDISNKPPIESLILSFYQLKDFKISENEFLEYPISDNSVDLTNIWVDNPYISLGYDLDRFKTDTVLLYTLDPLTYASFLSENMKEKITSALGTNFDLDDPTSNETYLELVDYIRNTDEGIMEYLNAMNKKDMTCKWIHFTSSDAKPDVVQLKEVEVSPGHFERQIVNLPENTKIHWCHYNLQEGITDEFGGDFWERCWDKEQQLEYKDFYPDITQQFERFKVIIEHPDKEYTAQQLYDSDALNSVRESSLLENVSIDWNKHQDETYRQWAERILEEIKAAYLVYAEVLSSENKLDNYEQHLLDLYYDELQRAFPGRDIQEVKMDPAAEKINEKYRILIRNAFNDLTDESTKYIKAEADINSFLGESYLYESEILEFKCEDELPSNITLQLIKSLTLEVDPDGFHGHYRIYDNEGKILSKKESQKKRLITAKWNSIVTGDRELDGTERISWYIPTENTMIEYPIEGIEYNYYEPFEVNSIDEFNNRNRVLYTRIKKADQTWEYHEVRGIDTYNENEKYFIISNTQTKSPTADNKYFLISRNGKDFLDRIPGEEEPSSSGQVFRIKEFYNQNYSNNTIICVIKKNNQEYMAQAELVFGPTGTNGTDYTFELEIKNKIPALTAHAGSQGSKITIIPHLYDYNNEDIIKRFVGHLKYSWYSPFNPVIQDNGRRDSSDSNIIIPSNEDGTLELTLPNNINIEDARYHILQGELTNCVDVQYKGITRKITLNTVLPIPVRASDIYTAIEGADKVSYDSSGVNPNYYKNPYKLYKYIENATTEYLGEIEGNNTYRVEWDVSLGSDTFGAISSTTERNFYPTISEQNILVPPSFYLKDNGKQIAVDAYKSIVTDRKVSLTTLKPYIAALLQYGSEADDCGGWGYNENENKSTLTKDTRKKIISIFGVGAVSEITAYMIGHSGDMLTTWQSIRDNTLPYQYATILSDFTVESQGQLLWTQPVYIYQNSYASTLLNSWDGGLTIDEETGIILSTAVGAGGKDEKNRFMGVLMGDLTEVDNTPTFGLYGYHEGVQSFGMKIDGTAFLGKSGRGQIQFDGNNARIQSMSYEKGSTGMQIDLDDGIIDMRGTTFKNVQYFDQNGESYTIDEVLAKQMEIMSNNIEAIEQERNKLHSHCDAPEIQKKNNEIKRYRDKFNKALAALTEFQALANADKYQQSKEEWNDYEKLLYLQDNNLGYLINDDLFTPYFEPSESRVRIAVTDPYAVITSNHNKDLLYIGNNTYFLQTDNFILAKNEYDNYPIKCATEELTRLEKENFLRNKYFQINNPAEGEDDYGDGLLLDLSHGFLLGYNFKLKGVNNGRSGNIKTDYMKDSYFELNSDGEPFLVTHLKTVDPDTLAPLVQRGLLAANTPLEKDLIHISKDEFYLQSFNYFKHTSDVVTEFLRSKISGVQYNALDPYSVGAGVLLDLTGGKLHGHDFEISAVDTGLSPTLQKNLVSGEYESTGSPEPQYTGSYVFLGSSGYPYFRIHYQNVPALASMPSATQAQREAIRNAYLSAGLWTQTDPETGLLINQNIDLINISKSAWEINSKDFQRPNPVSKSVGKGIHFDLYGDAPLSLSNNGDVRAGSYIEAYSFGLDAYKPNLIKQDVTQRIRINSAATGNIDLQSGNNGNIAIPVPDQDYLLLYSGSTSEASIQAEIDSVVKAHPEYSAVQIKEAIGGDSQGHYKVYVMNCQLYDNPLMLGGLFSVSWQGKVIMNYLVADQGGRIGPFTISKKALYSNNGKLANGQEFWQGSVKQQNVEPLPNGIYLGRDGLSVRDTFVIYKYPVNKWNKIPATQNGTNLNTNETHSLRIPINIVTANQSHQEKYNFIYDFVTSGQYTEAEKKQYFEDLDHSYDQVFYTVNNTKMALKDLSFYLNGNTVLNGVTAINGNTYIFGNMQIGEPVRDGQEFQGNKLNETNNTIVAYANTTIFGIFRTTGMTYLGDIDKKWCTATLELRDKAKTNSKRIASLTSDQNNDDSSKIGTIIYRNTYISGYLKVAGSMIVGDAVKDDIDNWAANGATYMGTDLHGDFSAYVKKSLFWGDVAVAAGFVAGVGSDTEPIDKSDNRFKLLIPNNNNLDEVYGSGIMSSNIFLGRVPNRDPVQVTNADGVQALTTNNDAQSKLGIYADTEQWGSFIAGRHGKVIELYAAGNWENTRPDSNGLSAAHLIMNQEKIEISTYTGTPLLIKTNGGNVDIDGTDHGEAAARGGSIYLRAGKGDEQKPVNLHLLAGDADFIKFTNQILEISCTGKLSIIVKNKVNGQEQKFIIDDKGIILSGHGQFVMIAETPDGISKIALNENGSSGKIEISSTVSGSNFSLKTKADNGDDVGFSIDAKGNIFFNGTGNFTLKLTRAEFSILEDGSITLKAKNISDQENSIIFNNEGLDITAYGSHMKFQLDDNHYFEIKKDGQMTLQSGTSNYIKFKKNNDDNTTSLLISGTGDFKLDSGDSHIYLTDGNIDISGKGDFKLTAGSNIFEMNKNQIKITSAAGPTATFDDNGIKLDSGVGPTAVFDGNGIQLSTNGGTPAYLKLYSNQDVAEFGIGGAKFVASLDNKGEAAMHIYGTTWVHGDIYADNLYSNGNQVQIGSSGFPSGVTIGGGGLIAGGGGIGLAGWIVNELTLESATGGAPNGNIKLNPVEARIEFSKNTDYIDGGGAGASNKGIRIGSGGGIVIGATSGVWLNSEGTTSLDVIGNTGLAVLKESIVFNETAVVNSNGQFIYLGGLPGTNGATTGQYWLKYDGTVRFHALEIANGSTVNFFIDSDGTLKVKKIEGYSSSGTGDLEISAATLTAKFTNSADFVWSNNTKVSIGRTSMTLGSSGDSYPLEIVQGNLTLTQGALLMKKGNATLTEGKLTLTKGDIIVTEGNVELSDSSKAVITNILKSSSGDLAVTANNGELILSRSSGSSIKIKNSSSGIEITGKIEASSTLKTEGNIFNGGGLYFGDSTSADHKIDSSGNGTLASLKIGSSTTMAQLTSSGAINGVSLNIGANGNGSNSGSNCYLSANSGGVSIYVSKNDKGWTNLSSSLGKLAFADDIKKKFKVILTASSSWHTGSRYYVSGSGYCFLTRLSDKTYYKPDPDLSPMPTLYKYKSDVTVPTLYTKDDDAPSSSQWFYYNPQRTLSNSITVYANNVVTLGWKEIDGNMRYVYETSDGYSPRNDSYAYYYYEYDSMYGYPFTTTRINNYMESCIPYIKCTNDDFGNLPLEFTTTDEITFVSSTSTTTTITLNDSEFG